MTNTSQYQFTSIRTGQRVIVCASNPDIASNHLPEGFDRSYGVDVRRLSTVRAGA
jgi:hypothetical protein